MTIEDVMGLLGEILNDELDGDGIVSWERIPDEDTIGIEMADGSLFALNVQPI